MKTILIFTLPLLLLGSCEEKATTNPQDLTLESYETISQKIENQKQEAQKLAELSKNKILKIDYTERVKLAETPVLLTLLEHTKNRLNLGAAYYQPGEAYDIRYAKKFENFIPSSLIVKELLSRDISIETKQNVEKWGEEIKVHEQKKLDSIELGDE